MQKTVDLTTIHNQGVKIQTCFQFITVYCKKSTVWAFTSADLPAGTMFWTSTPGSNNRIITRGVNSRNQSVSLYESSKANAFAVRCIRD